MKRKLGLAATAGIVTFLAGMIVVIVASAVREATKPVPGWQPTPSATAKQ